MYVKDTKARKVRDWIGIPLVCILLIVGSIIPSIVWGEEKVEVTKTISLKNPHLEFSTDTKQLGDRAVMTLINISTWKAESLWLDAKLINELSLKRLDILLNSPGGSAYQGMAIADELRIFKQMGVPVHIEGRGLIASAAIPILLMGDHRVCSENTVFLIHPASILKGGFFISREEMKDLQSQAKMMEMLEDMYAKAICNNTNLDYDTVRDMMTRDTWFDAEQALEWGFVHEIE